MWEIMNNTKISLNTEQKNGKKIITFFSHSSQLGGAERSLLALILELREKNILSHVVLPNHGPLEGELIKNNIPYNIVDLSWWADLNKITNDTIIQKNSNSLKNLLKFFPKLSLVNPDLIYSNTLVFPWGAIAANKLNKPHIWHIHEYGDLDHSLKFDSYYSEIIQFIEQYSDQIIVNSKSVIEHVEKFLIYNKKPILSYYFIKINPKLLVKLDKSPYKQTNSLKILVAATIHPGKNQIEATKVIKNLISDGVDAELLLLGSVANEDYLNKLNEYISKHNLTENIHIKSFVNNPYPYFLESDVVLVPSRKEAYGRTAVEGMLLKKPVVVTKEGGSNEIVINEKTGFSYHAGDLEALQKILVKLTNSKLRKKIANSAYKSLEKINSKQNYGYKIAKIINKTIKSYQLKNQLTNIAINIFERNLIKLNQTQDDLIQSTQKLLRAQEDLTQTKQELTQVQEDLDLFINSLEKNKLLKKKINETRHEIFQLELNLNKIKSAKFFKLWQMYNKIKKIF